MGFSSHLTFEYGNIKTEDNKKLRKKEKKGKARKRKEGMLHSACHFLQGGRTGFKQTPVPLFLGSSLPTQSASSKLVWRDL
jgi:hypothetical protein